jgi:chemotaxis protein CheC
MKQLSALQLDALREVANTGSGHAAADLSDMLGSRFSLSVPRAIATSLPDALDSLGGGETEVVSVSVRVVGDVEAALLALFTAQQADNLCGLLGVEARSEMGDSLLGEVGNVLACAYANVLGEMSGLEFDVSPPEVLRDYMGALVGTLVAATHNSPDQVLLIDTDLSVQEADCSMSVLFVPTGGGIERLLTSLGVA